MQKLLSSFGKKGVRIGLDTLKVDIEDTSFLSKYFVVSEFNTVFTAGKNPISFNGSTFLQPTSEIQIECLDSNGNSIYTEHPRSNVLFLAVSNYVISVHIYDETYNGPGQLILVGTTVKGEVVRWKANITIDKTLQNVSKVIFYNKPVMEARGLLYPIVTNDSATILTKTIPFNGYVYAEPVNPPADTNKKTINYKKTDIDYRITLNVENEIVSNALYPTKSFNSQMDGQFITLVTEQVHIPFTNIKNETNITGSFTIKKVLSDNTLQITEPIFYTNGKDQIVTTVDRGFITGSYIWIAYDTRTEAYNPDFHDSYAEIVYRNIKTFSGFVARHKLYRKSVVYPGDFELLVDEPTVSTEILVDPVTNNKVYNLIGTFFNQLHINKYWFSTSGTTLHHSTNPKINAIKISGSYDSMNGAEYVIVKADSPGIANTAEFQTIVYDESEFNNMYGLSYNTSFINLKANSQYALSMNVSIDKEKTAKGSVKFYYYGTGGSDITIEKNYEKEYGLLLGEISTDEFTTLKTFSEKQALFFTPMADYYGTLIIVPINCNVTLSDFSLKIYGDYGFSPDTMVIKIPFPINVAGESFQIKSELFDINSSLVYSDLQTIKTLDENGISTYTRIGDTSVSGLTSTTTLQSSGLIPASVGPQYITLTTVQNNVSVVAQSIAVAQGYHIWVDESGSKSKYYDV